MSSKFNIDKLFLFVYITGKSRIEAQSNFSSKLKAESNKIEVKKIRG
jgi:hypothetical protein